MEDEYRFDCKRCGLKHTDRDSIKGTPEPPTIPDEYLANTDQYLGDGVYATYDGHNIWLDLRGQEPKPEICLEPEVLQALDDYRERVKNL